MAGAALPQQCGNYQLVREIGRGAGSEVWLGRHVRIAEHTVALKILLAQDDAAVQRFEREATIAARLRHPSIARLIDWGFVHPYHYAAYELIDGKPLRELLNSDTPLDPVLALRIFRQTAAALAYAHATGVLHRDVSPGNILLTEHGARVVLIDFGIARSGESELTVSGALLGTRGYFAPEALLAADALDERSDLFSLGVVLYQMLSGRLPWRDRAFGRRGERALADLYPPPPTLRELGVTTLPADLDRVLQTMLAADPARRYASVQAALDDLERVIARSQSSRQLLSADGGAAAVPLKPGAAPVAAGFRSNGLASGPLERALGAALQREPLDRAAARAERLRDPALIADLLNRWSAARPLRRPLLGRLARLHQVTSRNLYFFQLRAALEERKLLPPLEQPLDADDAPAAPQRNVDIWQVPLPAPAARQPQAGRVTLPQTTRRALCEACDGEGEVLCRRCGGAVTLPPQADDDAGDESDAALPSAAPAPERPPWLQRADTAAARSPLPAAADAYDLPPVIARERAGRAPAQLQLADLLNARAARSPADDEDTDDLPPPPQRSGSGDGGSEGAVRGGTLRLPGLKRGRSAADDGPCRACDGSGVTVCQRCQGSGELLLTDVFLWSRRSLLLHDAGGLAPRDEAWLSRRCKPVTVYRVSADEPPAVWRQIEEVAGLLDEVQRGLGSTRRLIQCELTISMIPLSEITFDLGSDAEADRCRLAIYGFEQQIPADWRLLDWSRIVLLIIAALLAVLLVAAWFLR